jgi:hypothetical protein
MHAVDGGLVVGAGFGSAVAANSAPARCAMVTDHLVPHGRPECFTGLAAAATCVKVVRSVIPQLGLANVAIVRDH